MIITGKTRVAAVLGWPVEHTRSPAMLNAAFSADQIDAVLVPIGVPPEGLAAVIGGLRALRAPACLGASITVPHKLVAAALCDELSIAAKAIGAVNCLEFADDRLVGHNTDCDGFLDGLTAGGFDLRGKRVVLLGAGGAARAVAYGVRGASDNRNASVVARQIWPIRLGAAPDIGSFRRSCGYRLSGYRFKRWWKIAWADCQYSPTGDRQRHSLYCG